MVIVHCTWNHNGSLLAITGRQQDCEKENNLVQFYSPFGDHLRTLKVPGQSISCSVWEGGSLRIALAVDSFVYFANIRPNYKWCCFMKTVVFTSSRPQKAGICVSFWNTVNNQCHVRFVPVLLAVAGFDDHCVLATRSEAGETSRRYNLLLCNTLGTPVDGQYVNIETLYVTMNSTHVIAASKNNFIIWQYKTPKSSAFISNRFKCRMYHVDDSPSGAVEVIQDLEQTVEISVSSHPTSDSICCIVASDRTLIIGRESGILQQYALPHTALIKRYKMSSRPHKMSINCNSTRLSVIDLAGLLTVLDISEILMGQSNTCAAEESKRLERRDVWAMCWASDNPHLLAIMEKTRMYIFKGAYPEEPISCSGYICSFKDLEIRAVLLDEVMENPEKPNSSDHLIKLEVKSLRDTRQLLEKVGIKEAAQFIEDNPHLRLWQLLAEASLRELNLPMAESAFIRSLDYSGILFVKKLQKITNESVRRACVAAYFKNFDGAEKMFTDSDRTDLALTLRQTLGDWFRVIEIMKNGVTAPDLLLETAYNSTADYFAYFNNWAAAVEYYELAKNRNKMIECYYYLEDYDSLESMINALPENDPLLGKIANIFATDAVYAVAVRAHLKMENVKAAIDLCISHNKWDRAIELAKEYNFPKISDLFYKYTNHLIEQNMLPTAVEINVQAKFYFNAAIHTFKIAETESKKTLKPMFKIKKLYVFAGLLIEMHKKVTSTIVEGALLTDADILEHSWNGAEAYHYFMLAHNHLYNGRIHEAMLTAYKLQEYTNYISEVEIYSLIALTSYLDTSFGVCSKALFKLKLLSNLSQPQLQQCKRIALSIFSKHEPVDLRQNKVQCFNCGFLIYDWSLVCKNCQIRFPSCVVSGRSLIADSPRWVCTACHSVAIKSYMVLSTICPLCHKGLQ